jgi:hypothetical protein
MDDRIKIICDDDCEMDDLLPCFAAVNAFTEQHNWRAHLHENTITFWRAD